VVEAKESLGYLGIVETQIDEILSALIPQEGSLQETLATVSKNREPPVSDANSTDENATTSNTTPSQTEQCRYPKRQNRRKPARYTS